MPPGRDASSALAARLFGGWIRSVDGATLRADAIAGVLGALLVLPQALAFASLAGLPPEYGVHTAIVPVIVAALFGSSRHVVSGPTNAISLALLATLTTLAAAGSPAYIALALAVTVLVGVMQLAIGALRLGAVADFISPAALRGFTSGAAALIAVHALPDLLGLAAPSSHRVAAVVERIVADAGAASASALATGGTAIAATLAVRRWRPRWPSMLIGLAAAMAVAWAVERLGGALGTAPVEVVGAVPSVWPSFAVPVVDAAVLPDLVGIAFALTIVALGQSIAIAKAIAARSGQAIDVNRELRGQGLSNIVGGFFSSYVSCGSLNRSLPNFEAGARTPLAAVFASLSLLVLAAASGPLLARIPVPAIAGLLLLVAVALFDAPAWRRLWALERKDAAVALVTLVATVTIRLEMAILLGTLLSLVVYLLRTAKPAMRSMGFDRVGRERPFVVRADVPAPLAPCPQLEMLRMEGEVWFGAAAHVAETLRELRAPAAAPRHLLVMCKSMNHIDLAGAAVWEDELAARRGMGGDLWFHRPRGPVLETWERTGFIGRLGGDHVLPTKRIAIATIFDRLDRGICAHCTVRVFEECGTLPLPVPPWVGPPPEVPTVVHDDRGSSARSPDRGRATGA